MARIAWIFTDNVLSESYSFEINPKDDGSLQYEKTITYKNTSGPDGATVVFEGRDVPNATTFSGTILSEDQYNAMVHWFNKRYPITILDDLGREFLIYITKFSPKRKISRTHPWRHEYSVDYFVAQQ